VRVILWILRIAIFVFLLVFALKNTELVTVRFFFEAAWQAPLVMIVLAFFAGGVALGALLLLGTLFGLRREVARLRRALKDNQAQVPAVEVLVPDEVTALAQTGNAEKK
jgi:putative membrane protein